ncbi:cytochrome C oxidase subunit IV family protein [uncultured Chryseobacterium sp.]|uniref:cytochrome o ubiquinol oxidase subunit IV n=1 Tax=uncultured Chryseobacterium sp. TaxID=259322 RepID=UPI0025F14361|nr:cytochrome C oxidase subunit IV family protein [uncultured Chryseobacterium sp.]
MVHYEINKIKTELTRYIVATVICIGITLAAFSTVMYGLERTKALWIITLLAIVQIIVQLKYFLHLSFRQKNKEDLWLVLFSLVMLLITAGGTIWVLADLSNRMM